MTHSDIYTKFLIEYDKANITSSYPSLTDYEIGTLLDKAYLAVIAQKITGNNLRKVGFEGDTKAMEDIRPLIKTDELEESSSEFTTYVCDNERMFDLPDDHLYYISSICEYPDTSKQTTVLVNHEDALKFKVTSTNLPWINNPIVYLEDQQIHLLYDKYKISVEQGDTFKLRETYVKKPSKFILYPNNYKHFAGIALLPLNITFESYARDDYEVVFDPGTKTFVCKVGIISVTGPGLTVTTKYYANWKDRVDYCDYTIYYNDDDDKCYMLGKEGLTEVSNVTELQEFECSDSVAEEVINQAIVFAAETVESQRLTTKSNILQLEA